MSEPLELCGVRLRGPVLNGSGTFDAIAAHRAFGDELLASFPFDAFVSKTITVEPRQGNPPPRLWESPAGLINSIGLPNKGLAGFLSDDLPHLRGLPVPLVVSVMGFTRSELGALVAAVAARVEIPVIGMGGIASGRDARDFLAAGAACVAVGTESFRDPAAGRRIADELSVISRDERGFSEAGAR